MTGERGPVWENSVMYVARERERERERAREKERERESAEKM